MTTTELRADVPSLDALMEMYHAGLAFMDSESLPDDADDRDKMSAILAMLQDLMAAEGAEEERSVRPRAELRSVDFTDFDSSADGSHFTGYAAVFDAPTEYQTNDGRQVSEILTRGIFRKALGESRNVPMLWNHNHDWPLATTQGGTLRLKEDTKGLRVEADLGNDFVSDFVRERVKRGDVQGMSYGFIVGPGDQKIYRNGDTLVRKLSNFRKLLDVSPTYDPANTGTVAELRHLQHIMGEVMGNPQLDLSQLELDTDTGSGVALVTAKSWRQIAAQLI